VSRRFEAELRWFDANDFGEVRLEGKVVHRFQVDFDITFRYKKVGFELVGY